MSFFACAIHRGGDHVPESFRHAVESAPQSDGALHWRMSHGFVGTVSADAGSRPEFAQLGGALAVGTARLDNREQIAGALGEAGACSDLELAVRFLLRDQVAGVRRLLGDFAFVVWDPRSRMVTAARDAFGVRKLFHAELWPGVLGFSSHASLLSLDGRYDDQYLVERVCQCGSEPSRTVHAGVKAVRPGELLRLGDGGPVSSRFWSPAEVPRGTAMSERDSCDRFRELLVESVRLRLGDAGSTWAHLSGGLDSSSVVSIAQWLVERGELPNGLAGTVTYTDSLGTSADEREFSDAVLRRYGVRNELVSHRARSCDLVSDPLALDQPNMSPAMAMRDRASARLVRDAGGRTLLTGEAGDSLVTGTMFFFADWLMTGRAGKAMKEMAHRSALGRVSFWKLAYENAALPLLPRLPRRMLTRQRTTSVPPWIPRVVRRRFGLRDHSTHEQLYAGRLGHKYEDALVRTIGSIPSGMPLGPQEELLDVRHPYLYRPLVEFSLRLPPELCVRPHARKWILREAMRGILPEEVRTRVGKGALDGLNAWSLIHDRHRVDRLLHEPILADLGCVEPAILRSVLTGVRAGSAHDAVWRDLLDATLDVEMWLQLRSGRWAATDAQRTMQSVHHVTAGHGILTSTGHASRSTT